MDSEKQMIIKELSTEASKLFFKEDLETIRKNTKYSQKLRKEGNDVYIKVKNNAVALEDNFKLYSESIRYADCNSEDLALAYGNRSALLNRMKKYKEAISDIDKALKIPCSDAYELKLSKRKIDCLSNLDLSKENIEEIKSIVKEINEKFEDETLREKIDELYEKLDNFRVEEEENKDVPEHLKILQEKEKEDPFKSIWVKHNRKYGRYLVANRDFDPGEIIFVENPFARVINLNNVHMYCSHCFATSWSTIPCDHCSWCMYCSENCKKRAWDEYHSMECIIVAHILINIENNKLITRNYQMLTVRMLILGLKKAGNINKLRQELQFVDKCKDKRLRGFQKKNDRKVTGFSSIYTLNDEVSTVHLQEHTTNAMFTLLIIIKYSKLDKNLSKLEDIESILKNEDALFMGSLILKLYKISDKNSQQMPGEKYDVCKYSKDSETCHTTDCCSRGSCILMINSLINHSCDPNVKNAITSKQNFIVYSLEPIKKGSQIFITYLTTFYNMKKNKRQEMLKAGYNFDCDCAACENNWPTIEELMDMSRKRPIAFQKLMSQKENEHLFVEDELVRSIMMASSFECDQKTVEKLSKALKDALVDIKQPSIALWKLKSSVQRVFENLYLNLYRS